MTGSLPGRPRAVQRAGIRLAPILLPPVPDRLGRLLCGGRSVVVDGNTLDPTLQLLVTALRLLGVPGLVLDDEDLAASRQGMRDLCVSLGGPPAPMRVDELSLPGPAGPIGARHYRPACLERVPLLVFFHGGGYVLGDLDAYDALCRLICRDAAVGVLSIDYRRAPEHKAPAAHDDCCSAYRWAVSHAADLGVRADRVAVGGDSAGGGLAAAVCQWVRDHASEGLPLPALQVLLYPWTDIRTETRSRTLFSSGFVLTRHDLDWCGGQYLNGSGLDAADPRVSPGRAPNLAGLPPALVFTAGFDPLRDEGERYAAALADAGVPVELRAMGTLTHGFASFNALCGGCSRAITEMVSALAAHLRRG